MVTIVGPVPGGLERLAPGGCRAARSRARAAPRPAAGGAPSGSSTPARRAGVLERLADEPLVAARLVEQLRPGLDLARPRGRLRSRACHSRGGWRSTRRRTGSKRAASTIRVTTRRCCGRASDPCRSACRRASARRRSAPIVEQLAGLRERGADRRARRDRRRLADGTARIAADAGATVFSESALMAELGPVLGKGDAMWRALSVLDGELVCFLDADVARVLGALRDRAARPADRVRRGRLRQGLLPPPVPPWRASSSPTAAGASTTCSRARRSRSSTRRSPACASRWPARSRRGARCSSGCRSRPATASRSRCCSTCYEQVGLEGMAQVDLDDPPQQPPAAARALSAMAYAVLRVLAARLEREGRLLGARRPRRCCSRAARGRGAAAASARRWSARGERRALPRPRRHAARRAARRCCTTARAASRCSASRAIEACLRARRRGRADERAPARAGRRGRAPARPARVHLRGRLRARARRRGAVADRAGRRASARVHEQIERLGRARAAARALRRAGSSTTTPGTADREVSHLFRGLRRRRTRPTRCSREHGHGEPAARRQRRRCAARSRDARGARRCAPTT